MATPQHEPVRTDQRLTPEEQQAVLVLAVRLQQEYDEGATLADLIQIGQEAGLSREAIEDAYTRIVSQPSEKTRREQLGRKLSNELAAVHLTVLWGLATWAGTLFLPVHEAAGFIGIAGTFFVFPVLVGILVKRPWVATALAMSIALNLMIALTVRLGFPHEAGGRGDLLIFILPAILACLFSSLNWFISNQRAKSVQNRSD